MEITFEDFCRACPAAMAPSPEIFESISDFIRSFTKKAIEIITPDIFARLNNPTATEDDIDRLEELRSDAIVYICAASFYMAIPHLDLVLTSTGFGVVSNQNVAPASIDRVERLRSALRKSFLKHFESMIDNLRHFDAWQGSKIQKVVFISLFWKSDHVKCLGLPLATRDDLIEWRPKLVNAEYKVGELISRTQLLELISLESRAAASPLQSMAIDYCRAYVAAIVLELPAIELHRRTLLGFIEANPEEFAIYHVSQTYKANHFEPYQNKKDDSCFFFG